MPIKYRNDLFNKYHTKEKVEALGYYADRVEVNEATGSVHIVSYKGEGIKDYASTGDFIHDIDIDEREWLNGKLPGDE